MRLPRRRNHRGACRRGKILILFAMLLPVLLGLVGLVIDAGQLMIAQRRAQNAADAAALRAAVRLFRGETDSDVYGNPTYTTIQTDVNTFISDSKYNGLSTVTPLVVNDYQNHPYNTINIPPQQAIYPGLNGNSQFAEVWITYPVQTSFIQILGVSSTQSVRAHAVAGYEPVATGEGIIALDPGQANPNRGIPGLSVSGGGILLVNGGVVVNSRGSGVDSDGVSTIAPPPGGWPTYALTVENNSTIKARDVQVAGAVDNPGNIQPYDSGITGTPYISTAGTRFAADPLRTLPVPQVMQMGQYSLGTNTSGAAQSWSWGNTLAPGMNGLPNTITLGPGIYNDIFISGSANVTFLPGIYVLTPDRNNPNTQIQQGLRITGTPTITGNGVMFYMAGDNYVNSSNPAQNWPTLPSSFAAYDMADGNVDGPLPGIDGPLSINSFTTPAEGASYFNTEKFAQFTIQASQGAHITLTGLNAGDPMNPGGMYTGMLLFQRRRAGLSSSPPNLSIQNNAGTAVTLSGILYAKWANFNITGGGVYNAQFIVGTMTLSGQSNLTINGTGNSFDKALQVFLYE